MLDIKDQYLEVFRQSCEDKLFWVLFYNPLKEDDIILKRVISTRTRDRLVADNRVSLWNGYRKDGTAVVKYRNIAILPYTIHTSVINEFKKAIATTYNPHKDRLCDYRISDYPEILI